MLGGAYLSQLAQILGLDLNLGRPWLCYPSHLKFWDTRTPLEKNLAFKRKKSIRSKLQGKNHVLHKKPLLSPSFPFYPYLKTNYQNSQYLIEIEVSNNDHTPIPLPCHVNTCTLRANCRVPVL